jgi:hypothetical protein
MIPGSSEVLDRATGRLVPCARGLCTEEVQLAVAGSGSNPAATRPTVTGTTPITPATNSRFINRAPYFGPASIAGGLNPHNSPQYKRITFSLLSVVTSRNFSNEWIVMSQFSPLGER